MTARERYGALLYQTGGKPSVGYRARKSARIAKKTAKKTGAKNAKKK